MAGYHAKKRLGQNFLISEEIINRIVTTINPESDSDTIIEIGPGRGALTLALAQTGVKIIAVEYDRNLIAYLEKLLKPFNNVQLINTDFLSYQPNITGYKLVGNLPYNITSPVIEWTMRNVEALKSAFFMMQKEFAQRVISSPGSKDWSPLAIFTQQFFKIEKGFDIPPDCFSPQPKVTSSFLKFTPDKKGEIIHFAQFEKLVRLAFKQRRKILLNNLIPDIIPDLVVAKEIFEKLKISEKSRAEQLSTEQFLALTNYLVNHNIINIKQ